MEQILLSKAHSLKDLSNRVATGCHGSFSFYKNRCTLTVLDALNTETSFCILNKENIEPATAMSSAKNRTSLYIYMCPIARKQTFQHVQPAKTAAVQSDHSLC